ncbi:MAG: hypothetical protein DRN53_04175 [Thermoprotei archaeon]|nr:MAG: hypothetical protein DRN53_04175 [Thermoprotei archaeon]
MKLLNSSLENLDVDSIVYFGLLSENSEILFYAGDPDFNEVARSLVQLASKLSMDRIIAKSKLGFIAVLKLHSTYSMLITEDEGDLAVFLSLLERNLKSSRLDSHKKDLMISSTSSYSFKHSS